MEKTVRELAEFLHGKLENENFCMANWKTTHLN